jgi:hypothetical protein
MSAENKGNINVLAPLDNCITNDRMMAVAKKKTTKLPVVVTFRPGPEDYEIIEAGKSKHGLKKTTDLLRMALRRFAEADLKAS